MLKLNGNYSLNISQFQRADGSIELSLIFNPIDSGKSNFSDVEAVKEILNNTPQTQLSQSPTQQENKLDVQNLLNQAPALPSLPIQSIPQLPQLQPVQQLPQQLSQPEPVLQPWQQPIIPVPAPVTTQQVTTTMPLQFQPQPSMVTTPSVIEELPVVQQPWMTQPTPQNNQPVAEPKEEKPKTTRKKKEAEAPPENAPQNDDIVVVGPYKITKNSDGTVVFTNQTTNQQTMLQYPKSSNGFITIEVYPDGFNKYSSVLGKYGAEANQQKQCYSVCVTEEVFVTEIMSQLTE